MTFENKAEKMYLAEFGERQELAFKGLARLAKQKKRIEEKEKEIKSGIMDAMVSYGVKSFKNDLITLTLVPGSTTETIDLNALQNREPELYEELLADYPKKTRREPYVRFTLPK